MADAVIDMTRHHQNNLDHASKVFLSVLFSTPKELWVDAIEKLMTDATDRLTAGHPPHRNED